MHKLALGAVVAIGLVAAAVSHGPPVEHVLPHEATRTATTTQARGLRRASGSIARHPDLVHSNCDTEEPAGHADSWRCGFVTIDRPDGLGGDTMKLWVEVVGPQTTPRPPILFVPGGPGRSGTDRVRNDIERFPELVQDWDAIFIDPRGTGKSDGKLTCERNVGDAWDRCFRNIEPTGIDTSLYSAAAIADDLDALRTALGISEWHLHGSSYGGEVAQHMLLRNPKPILTAVLSVPTSVDVPQPMSNHRSVREGIIRALRLCEDSETCAQGERDLPQRFKQLLPRLANRPLPRSDIGVRPTAPAEVVDAIDATYAAWMTTVDWRLMHRVGELLLSLEAGETAVWSQIVRFGGEGSNHVDAPVVRHPLNDLSSTQARRTRHINWVLNHALTLCNDGAAGQLSSDWEIGLAWWDWWRDKGSATTQCANAGIRAAEPVVQPDAIAPVPPILILVGSHDTRAPLTDAKLISKRFPAASLVVLPWYSHVGMWEDPCPQFVMQSLWRQLRQPRNAERCAADLTFENIYGEDCERDLGFAVPLFCEHQWYDGSPPVLVPVD